MRRRDRSCDGLWYVYERDSREMLDDDCVWPPGSARSIDPVASYDCLSID